MNDHGLRRRLRGATVLLSTTALALALASAPMATASPLDDILDQLDLGSSAPPMAGPDDEYTVSVRYTGQVREYPSSFLVGGDRTCVEVGDVESDPMRHGRTELAFSVFQDGGRCRGATSGSRTLGILLSGKDFRAGYFYVRMRSDGTGTVACAPLPATTPVDDLIPLQCSADGDTVTYSK
ncbi:hypothetical protein [Gordonia sp. 'Campus']|jgi:hypothetical protein|uniref:hypothetical protein n=1 Tax=Gordonia sp. 'Campus' TaxID=2915824 RepID=UPI001EE45120|nr:hypothetical protein [Gordonia sp. 'Campus']